MHTSHNEEGAERAHQDRNDPASIIIEPVEADSQDLADNVAQRAGDSDAQDAGHDDGEHGRQEDLDRLGRDLIGKALDIGLNPDDEQDGDDTAAVGDHRHRYETEQQNRISRVQSGKTAVEQNTRQRSADKRVAVEVPRRRVCRMGHSALKRR